MPDQQPSPRPPRTGFGRLTHPYARLGLLVALLTAAACSLLYWSPQAVIAHGFTGPWAAPLFVLFFGVGTSTVIPKPVLSAAAGMLFGVAEGLTLAMAGITLSAALAFGLGRCLGREAVRPLVRGRLLREIDRRLTEQGFRSVLLLRLLPGIPFNTASYGAAFSAIRVTPFLTATVIGSLPGTAAYAAAGASAALPGSPLFLTSAAAIVLLAAAGTWAVWRSRRGSGPEASEES